MVSQEDYGRTLAYFAVPNHPHSFVLLPGRGKVLLSAPHAVLQTRNERVKYAERFTGMLCLLLNEHFGFPVIYKSRHLQDDANHDAVSDYRNALCEHIKQTDIQCLLDLHQLAPEREMDLCICTGKGQNLRGHQPIVSIVEQGFRKHGLPSITIDDPFDASNPCTVSATVARECGIPAVQLEINTRLLMESCPEYRFSAVFDALGDMTATLNEYDFSFPNRQEGRA